MVFVGKIGFWEEEIEVKPGVYRPKIIERSYTGKITQNYRRFDSREDSQNDNFTLRNRFSIIADTYMRTHFNTIRYVLWNGVRWQVTSVEVGFPRLELEIGDEYNVADAPEDACGPDSDVGKDSWCM